MKWTRFKILITPGYRVIALSLIVSLSGCEENNKGGIDPGDASSMGKWKVTEFSGSILNERTGGGDPLLCPYFKETYSPVLGDDQTYIYFQNRTRDPELPKISMDVYDTLNIIYEGGVFIFHVSFDNGYYGNESLEGSGVQYYYSDFIPGSWTFSVGFWTEEGVHGEIRAGNSSGGFSSFHLKGMFKNDDLIEGQWTWEEITAWSVIPAECTSEAYGTGQWSAVRK